MPGKNAYNEMYTMLQKAQPAFGLKGERREAFCKI